MHVVLDQRHVRYVLVSADEVRRFAPLPRTVYLVVIQESYAVSKIRVTIMSFRILLQQAQ